MKINIFFIYLTNILVTAAKHSKEDDDNDNFKITRRIINGGQATQSQFPWQVGIFLVIDNETKFCGGALISNQWVLTAAHCVDGARDFQIVLGATKIIDNQPGKITLDVSKAFYHPNFNQSYSFDNDVAVLQLQQPIRTSDTIKPIRLPQYGKKLKAHTRVLVSGWGKTSGAQNTAFNDLQYVEVVAITNEKCKKIYDPGVIQDTVVCCQGLGTKSTCHGDSGSPLIEQHSGEWTSVGVVSFLHFDECENGDPIAFSRTESYLDFIYGYTGLWPS